jgi:hypothetical protein
MEAPRSEIHWNEQLENVIAAEAERCRGYAWIHMRAEQRQQRRANFLAIPVIVLSTLAGSASIGSTSLFGDTPWASTGIGAVQILVGVLQTLASYFQYSRRSEAHHQAYIQYSKLFSAVQVEMGLPRVERKGPN